MTIELRHDRDLVPALDSRDNADQAATNDAREASARDSGTAYPTDHRGGVAGLQQRVPCAAASNH